jgi:hypothetical protein
MNGIESDLDRKFAAVLALAVKIGRRCQHKFPSSRGMAGAESLGNEYLDRFADQLVARIAKFVRHPSVDQKDDAFFVNQQHTIGCGLEQNAEFRAGGLALDPEHAERS